MALLIALSLGVLCLSLIIMQRTVSVLNIRQLTIPGFFYLTYLLFTFLPSIFVALDKPDPYRDRYFLGVISILVTVPLGICITSFILRFRRREISTFFLRPIEESRPSFHSRVVFVLLLSGALTIVVLYLTEVRLVPLFEILRNPVDYLGAVQQREESFKLLDTPLIYLYFLLRVLIFPFLTVLALGYYLHTGRRTWLIFFSVSLLAGTFYASLSTAKWPVVVMFFTIFLFVYIYKRGHISKVLGLLLAGAMLAFPVFVLLVIAAEMDVGVLDALKAIAIRAFYDPAESIYYYFEIFPATMDYLFGRSIGKLAWLMGWEYFDVPNYVHIYRFPRGILSGSANAGFIANLNADFGLFGVALGGFSVGLLMQVIQISIFRRKKTILGLAIYSFLVFAFFLLNFAALPVVLLSNGVIVALMVPSAIRIFESFLKKAIQRQGRTEYGIQR